MKGKRLRRWVLASLCLFAVAVGAWHLMYGPPEPGYVRVGSVSALLSTPRTVILNGHPIRVASGDDPNLYAGSAWGQCLSYQLEIEHGTAYVDPRPHPCVTELFRGVYPVKVPNTAPDLPFIPRGPLPPPGGGHPR
jgi:hypothetical protein